MPIISDLTIDTFKFNPDNFAESTKQANNILEQVSTNGPKWFEVGAATYRKMHYEGKLALPAPVTLPNAVSFSIPSRDAGRDIPIRVYKPDNGVSSRGVFIHIHGGGFVLGDERSFDQTLEMYANKTHLTTISIGYRHAPEHPYPHPLNDCIDAAEYLIDHSTEYGAVKFIGGESAGAALSVLSMLHLLASRPEHAFSGLVLQFGLYDLSMGLPAVVNSTRPLMINRIAVQHFMDALLPGLSTEERRNSAISPLFVDLQSLARNSKRGLPPALFVVGTEDCLLDDSLLFGLKWSAAGAESVVKVFPGAPHGFTVIPGLEVGEEARGVCVNFVNEKLE
ncbi:Alpha/Beta hydrolase protein [Aspergillus karnatakaensis]|uniref:alpha/beta hydrolase n=1 Tax=Aspergillus karnatakaensis TaxID=1810916 RepID=UPI003CCDCB58